jgi:hypothetical protein
MYQVDRYQATVLWSGEAVAQVVLSSRDLNTLRTVRVMMWKRNGRGGMRVWVCVALCCVCVCV